jgi:hypothetical protein
MLKGLLVTLVLLSSFTATAKSPDSQGIQPDQTANSEPDDGVGGFIRRNVPRASGFAGFQETSTGRVDARSSAYMDSGDSGLSAAFEESCDADLVAFLG